MADQIVSIVVTDQDQARLAQCVERVKDFGRGDFSLIEDVMARKAWDALEADSET